MLQGYGEKNLEKYIDAVESLPQKMVAAPVKLVHDR